MPLMDAMKLVLDRHYPVYPVVDAEKRLVGLLRGQSMFEAQAIEISLQAGSMVGLEKEERLATPVLRSLKMRHPWLQFNLLTDATCVDRYPVGPRFELNYHLVSIPRRDKVRLQVRVSGDDPVVDSLVPVWPGANWLEREIFDLFGIRFSGHPDLRRILLPDDWEGYPLRRDYPVEGFRDVPSTGELFRKSSTL